MVCVFVTRTVAGNAHPRYTTALRMERAICPVPLAGRGIVGRRCFSKGVEKMLATTRTAECTFPCVKYVLTLRDVGTVSLRPGGLPCASTSFGTGRDTELRMLASNIEFGPHEMQDFGIPINYCGNSICTPERLSSGRYLCPRLTRNQTNGNETKSI